MAAEISRARGTRRALSAIALAAGLAGSVGLWVSAHHPARKLESVRAALPEVPGDAPAMRPRAAAPRAGSAVAAGANVPPKRQTVVEAGWGSAVGELGHDRPNEGAPVGPMSLAIDGRGRMRVLDQVNARIEIFEAGKPTHAVSLPDGHYQDIDVDASGQSVVLDRLVSSQVAVIDERGRVLSKIPINGAGLSEGGAATALLSSEDGIFVEAEHDRLIRVADASGSPDRERPLLPGRPSLDGTTLLRAGLERPNSVVVRGLGRDGGALWSTRLDFDLPASSIRALESDASGRVYVAVHMLLEQSTPPFDVVDEKQVMVVLTGSGDELGRIEMAAPTTPEEQFRPIRVAPDGAIYQLVLNQDGARIERYFL